ncbi:MAG: type II toxin-antitoxin system RelB/DinJ family antitoxin [Deltaproteobacteria bacterium]|jgi:addiction module RelB/DinJ family antitoxin|nr:type II toxin-antitoxin system RelB/DinJ family antitoxin [Deltaproteobacteria bacterium]
MTTITIQVDARVKSEAEAVLAVQGLSLGDIVNLVLRRIIAAEKRLPAYLAVPRDHEGEHLGTGQPGDDLASIQAFGMWADRDDMENPSQWVRELRRGRHRDL